MAGGENIIGIVLGAGTLIGLAYAGSRLIAAMAANKRPTMAVYGDVPSLHPEMLGGETASEIAGGGGGRRKADRLDTQSQRTNPFRTGDERFPKP